MTDRPRVWTLRHGGGVSQVPIWVGPPIERDDPVVVVEWDREKVLPVIRAVQEGAWTRSMAGDLDFDLAEMIFDALDREGGA